MERSILHLNIVNFFVSVACVLEPKLISYPVAVVSAGASRRVVLDVSEQAYCAGIRRGMAADTAKRRLRDLVVVNPVPAAYEKVEKLLVKQGAQISPKAETAGPGHLFVDLTGTKRLLGPAVDIGQRLRKDFRTYGFDSAVGIGSNKLVSKVATRIIKPAGICTVIDGCEEELMAPLPLSLLPGLEGRILNKLLQFNIQVVHDLLFIPVSKLETVVGPVAQEICSAARGIDLSPVREITEPPPSILESVVLDEQTNDEHRIARALFGLISKAGFRMRRMGLAAGVITVGITYGDSATVSKSMKPAIALSGDLSLFEFAHKLLLGIFTRRVRLTKIDLNLKQLTFPCGQLDLFLNNANEEYLMSAMDTIRDRFGEKAVKFWGREQA